MRRSIAKIPYRASTTSSLAAFSTGGGGRGRGGGSPPIFPFDGPTENADPPPNGHGRGRGKPLPSSPIIPSFSSFVNNPPPSGRGRGRGFVLPDSNLPPPPPPQDESRRPSPKSEPPMPFLFGNEEDTQNDSAPPVQDNGLSTNIVNILTGAGQGKPVRPQSGQRTVENRHIRRAPQPVSDAAVVNRDQLSTVEKVKRAKEILSKGGEAEVGLRETEGGFRGESGERDWRRDDIYSESEDELEKESVNPAEIEEQIAELTKELGPEFTSVFDEKKWRLPRMLSPTELDALDENLSIECEPEFLMEVFGTNPDIDEKPPIPLRDALEKIKPYLMANAGIQTQEEWEKYMEKAMKSVPLLKEIVDHYSGPDRVTAKEQQKELQRVAETLPAKVPDYVKQFTDRVVLSLQSNPGWRFDQKCKFMDKLVSEVSQHYK